jgi:hypothetical protein
VSRQAYSLRLLVERALSYDVVLDFFVLEFVEFLALLFVDIFSALFVHRGRQVQRLWVAASLTA